MNYGWGDKHTDTQTHRHINTMTWPGLGAGSSENYGSAEIQITGLQKYQ